MYSTGINEILRTVACLLAAVLLVGNAARSEADDAAELSKYLPDGANTIAVVRLSQILKTDRAQADAWQQRQEERFLSGAAALPPWIDTLVVGSLVHPAVPEEVWAAAVTQMPVDVTLESLAEREGASVEDLAGAPAVRTRRNSYLSQPRQGLLAAFRPAHRLEASRWIRSIANVEQASLSPYLAQAVRQPGHIVVALDLTDLLDVPRVQQFLREDKRFASNADLVDRLTPLLVGAKGVTFSAAIGEQTQATVAIEFSDDIGPSSLTVKTLFVSILDDLGAAIDEFADSRVTSDGRSVRLEVRLSDESLRRIVSLIATPSAPYEIPEAARSEDSSKPRSGGRQANPYDPAKRYVAAVNRMIDDLQRANRRATDYARTAAWHDNFARKIDELPMEGVNRELLTLGQRVASSFRALAASLRGQAVQVNVQQQTLTYDVDYRPGWVGVSIWGAVGYGEPSYRVTSNLQEVRERQADAISAGFNEREQIWQLIQNDRAEMNAILDNSPPAPAR